METKIREATRQDIRFIAANLRDEDVAEIKAVHGEGANLDTLMYMAFLSSAPCHVFCDPRGEPLAAFGFTPSHPEGVGIPWLLGTDKLKLHALAYIRKSRKEVRRVLKEQFGYLFNFVHDKNKSSIKFLKAVGFEMGEPEERGDYGEKFRLFEMGDKEGCLKSAESDTLLTGDLN